METTGKPGYSDRKFHENHKETRVSRPETTGKPRVPNREPGVAREETKLKLGLNLIEVVLINIDIFDSQPKNKNCICAKQVPVSCYKYSWQIYNSS